MGDIHSIVVEEDLDTYSTWFHAFPNQNTTWLAFDTRQVIGNFYLGLQAWTANHWNTQIPPGSTILAATMEFTPFRTNLNPPFNCNINSPNRGLDKFEMLGIQKPFEYYDGWTKERFADIDMHVLDDGGGLVEETSGGINNRSWTVKQNLLAPGANYAWREQMAQYFLWPVDEKIGSVTLQMVAVGVVPGSARIEMRETELSNVGIGNPLGVPIPTDVVLATSDDVLMSTVPTAPTTGSPITFNFSGADEFNPGLNTPIALVFASDYDSGTGNIVRLRYQTTFFNAGGLRQFGSGIGGDWQNYPSNADLLAAYAQFGYQFPDSNNVDWNLAFVVEGLPVVSPSVANLIQLQVDAANYTADAGMCLVIKDIVPTTSARIMSSNANALWPGPILRVTYEEPDPAKTRTHDKFNKLSDQIYREDEEIIMIGRGLVEICNRPH